MAQGGTSEKQKPNEHSYDAIVIGSGMGALAFASIAHISRFMGRSRNAYPAYP